MTQSDRARPDRSVAARVVTDLPAMTSWLHKHLDVSSTARLEHGSAYTLDLKGQSAVVLNHPDLARVVLQQPGRYLKPFHRFTYIGDDSERRLQLRRLRPCVHRHQLVALWGVMAAGVGDALRRREELDSDVIGDPFEVLNEVSLVGVVRAVFGADISEGDERCLVRAVQSMMSRKAQEESDGGLRATASIRGELDVFDSVFDKVMSHCTLRRDREGRQLCLLTILAELTEDGGDGRFTLEWLREEVLFFLFAGFRNVAHMLTSALGLLQEHSAERLKAIAEVQAVIRSGRGVSELYCELPYSSMVIREALRMHPPVPWLIRQATERDVLGRENVLPGSLVVLPIKVYHYDPEFWVDPCRFVPERFNAANLANQHPCAWLPFGKGQRVCLGKDLGLMEGVLVLGMVLERQAAELRDGIL